MNRDIIGIDEDVEKFLKLIDDRECKGSKNVIEALST